MRSPWDSDYPAGDTGGGINQERSTSAPPPPTSLGIGDNEGEATPNGTYLNGLRDNGNFALKTPFDTRNKSDGTRNASFLDSSGPLENNLFSSSYESPPPGFSFDLPANQSLSSSMPRQGGFDSGRFGSTDRIPKAESMTRSHSATPSMNGFGPPPGLQEGSTFSATPPSNDSYLEPSLDDTHIAQQGQERPSSTGVIGGHQVSTSVLNSLGLGSANGDAVRPSAKTWMGLISEDIPPDSSPEERALSPPYQAGGTLNGHTPLSQHSREYGYDGARHRGDAEEMTELYDRYRTNGQHPYVAADRQMQNPQFEHDRGVRNHLDSRGIGPIYNSPAQPNRLQHPNPHSHLGQFEEAGFRRDHQIQPQIQTQLQAAHPVYVNTQQPQPAYGFSAVQYHPPQQSHIIHQSLPTAMLPNGEQYVSVVPIQGPATTPVQGVHGVSAGGAYAYFPPDNQLGATQTFTILNAHGPGGVPVTVAHIPNGREQPRPSHGNSHAGRHKEKGGKGKRGGNGNSRRGADAKQSANGVSSPLLEDFKAKKHRDWTIRDIKGHVVEFCQDQNGSRFIQNRLKPPDDEAQNASRDEEMGIVMHEVLPAVHRLRNDVFGNYVVQMLLENGTSEMKTDITSTLQGEMYQLSLQMYGCRVVQTALRCLDEADIPGLLAEFHNNVLSCIHDQNGNHVIQKCIEVVSARAKESQQAGDVAKARFLCEMIDFIVDDVLGNVQELSCHPYGCRVLQRILEHCGEPKKGRALDEISKCHRTLLDDQYGNYVIQHVLKFGRNSDRDSILELVAENGLLQLSRQKFASNVVEKLLKHGTNTQRKAIVREMLKVVDERSGIQVPDNVEGTSVVLLMVRDAYANYVVQTTLDEIAEGEEKNLLMDELNAHAAELKNYTFAKHIVAKLGQ